MKKQLMSAFTALLFSVVFTSVNAQQLKVPAPSPTQTIKQSFIQIIMKLLKHKVIIV